MTTPRRPPTPSLSWEKVEEIERNCPDLAVVGVLLRALREVCEERDGTRVELERVLGLSPETRAAHGAVVIAAQAQQELHDLRAQLATAQAEIERRTVDPRALSERVRRFRKHLSEGEPWTLHEHIELLDVVQRALATGDAAQRAVETLRKVEALLETRVLTAQWNEDEIGVLVETIDGDYEHTLVNAPTLIDALAKLLEGE